MQRQKEEKQVHPTELLWYRIPLKETESVLKNRASSPNTDSEEPPSVQLGSVSRGGRPIAGGLARSTHRTKCLCSTANRLQTFSGAF